MRLELSVSENKIDILRIILLEQSILELGLSSTHNAIVPRRVDYCWVSRLMNFCHLLSGTYSLAVHVWKSSFFKKISIDKKKRKKRFVIWVQSKKKVIWKWWNCDKTDLFRQGCDDLLYEHIFVEWASYQGIKMRPYSEASHVFLIAHLSRNTLRGRRLIGYKRLNNKDTSLTIQRAKQDALPYDNYCSSCLWRMSSSCAR